MPMAVKPGVLTGWRAALAGRFLQISSFHLDIPATSRDLPHRVFALFAIGCRALASSMPSPFRSD